MGAWTGEPAPWLLKIAPLLIPPFRSLFLNENEDFVPGTVANIRFELGRFLSGAASEAFCRVTDVTSGYAVAAAARLLQSCGYPHRAVFRRMPRTEPLHLPEVPANGDAVERFHQRESWDGDLLESAARRSHARWILWHRDGAAEPVDGMLAPFADERAFAVSVQTHFRAWKPGLLPMAPFRTLPPGVAAQVLAPLSNAILVDRRKLLALGVPRCGLPGTAWLILFWKAAAAGWRSYSVGQPEPIVEQPDFPMEETEFFVRLLCQPELRKLAPREPDLSRGTIAFAPRHRKAPRPRGERPRVLLVSPFLPYPLSHGGAVRIYNLCRALCGRVDFALAAIREKHDVVQYEKLHEIFEKVFVVDVDELPSADRSLPSQVRHHQSRSLRALVKRVSAQWNPDVLQIEYTHMAAFRDSAPAIPAVLVEHDLTFTLYRQLAEKNGGPEDWREYERWRNFETRWLREFDSVWTVSDEDREVALNEGSNPGATYAIPNGVDTERFVPREDRTTSPEILYVGSFRHLPNVLGFEKLRTEVMPRVWRRHPNARLRVVGGPRHESYWSGWSELDSRIVVHGFVEDLRPLYASAAVVVAPLEVSAGTNIKVLEAMACGKALVTTPPGCAGLGLTHGRDALIESEWPGFADAVAALLDDRSLRMKLALEARRTVERSYSWTTIAARAYATYENLAVRA